MELVEGYRTRADKIREIAATEPDGFTRRDMLLFADLLDLAAQRRELLIRSYLIRLAPSPARPSRAAIAAR